jgi:hypothetical protein
MYTCSVQPIPISNGHNNMNMRSSEYYQNHDENHNEITHKILILGVTESGEKFRPSDWAERISGCLLDFSQRRPRYSPLLQPLSYEGYRCLVIDPRLSESNPLVFQSILDFAKSNHLLISELPTH